MHNEKCQNMDDAKGLEEIVYDGSVTSSTSTETSVASNTVVVPSHR
jgi:hypothetical protein